ncbi:hypothetical protein KIN20_025255 [Parelaphostrongylus tenuis]|uniref:Tyrosinase copper-binding domain-containing protein n=1 Tax=Parelaphostrongylus tenuis TaxID=148309 RepID=A0AAD5NBR3_PARTN|nr:hypothetical protein KIN20_025255 [Parelaphostrongylus tenuis]
MYNSGISLASISLIKRGTSIFNSLIQQLAQHIVLALAIGCSAEADMYTVVVGETAESAVDPPFLFPHGYFDSAKLRPIDAIYLNMLAQSNLEYGGITLESSDGDDDLKNCRELFQSYPLEWGNPHRRLCALSQMQLEIDQLRTSRKVVPRPSKLPRDREEDDASLDRLPLDTGEFSEKNTIKKPTGQTRLHVIGSAM